MSSAAINSNQQQAAVFWKLQDFTAHNDDVSCLCLGQKTAKIMATGSMDNSVNIWSVNKPQRIMNLTGQSAPISAVNFNISDELLLAGSQAGIIKLWDLQAAKIIRTMSCHKSAVKAFAFHPYADVVATGAADSSLKLWDLRRKGMLYHFKWHNKTVSSLSFSPDGMWLASTSDDSTSKLTELKTGSLIADFKDHSGPVNAGVFHPNDFLYATGSNDKTVKFWDLETFQLVGSSQPENQPIKSIYFEQNGSFLFSATDNSLKMHAWEPRTSVLDSVVVNWGHVGAIGQITCQINSNPVPALLVANYSKTSVSTHVVDYTRLNSQLNNDAAANDGAQQPDNAPLKPPNYSSGGTRRNFAKENKQGGSVNSNENDDEDTVSKVQIENEADYREIFSPKTRLDRSPGRDGQMFQPPSGVSVSPQPQSQENGRLAPSAAPINANVKLEPRPHTSCRAASPKEDPTTSNSNNKANYNNNVNNNRVDRKESDRRGSPNDIQRNRLGSQQQQQQQFRNPSPVSKKANEFDSSLIAEFDQKIKMNAAQIDLGRGDDTALNVDHILTRVNRGHETVRDTLIDRMRKLETLRSLLASSTADPFISWKRVAEDAVSFCDQSVTNDLLSVLNTKQSAWSLDLVSSIIPNVVELCRSRHQTYVTNGLAALKLAVKLFGSLIKQNVMTDINGIDISHEERKKKSDKCYKVIMSFLPELQDKCTSVSDRESQAVYRELVSLITSKL